MSYVLRARGRDLPRHVPDRGEGAQAAFDRVLGDLDLRPADVLSFWQLGDIATALADPGDASRVNPRDRSPGREMIDVVRNPAPVAKPAAGGGAVQYRER